MQPRTVGQAGVHHGRRVIEPQTERRDHPLGQPRDLSGRRVQVDALHPAAPLYVRPPGPFTMISVTVGSASQGSSGPRPPTSSTSAVEDAARPRPEAQRRLVAQQRPISAAVRRGRRARIERRRPASRRCTESRSADRRPPTRHAARPLRRGSIRCGSAPRRAGLRQRRRASRHGNTPASITRATDDRTDTVASTGTPSTSLDVARTERATRLFDQHRAGARRSQACALRVATRGSTREAPRCSRRRPRHNASTAGASHGTPTSTIVGRHVSRATRRPRPRPPRDDVRR